ncbi:MAG: DNA gyrase inhibitor YacG [Gemmataceae bacterium]|jgi:endogenous inhibitor of DNA gyrase (YacG/DUF329 family)|nr:DNA gyrase inhibitor YacG [Gemmataceae bacterium]
MKRTYPKCPICDKELRGQIIEWPQYPFCSPRCKMIDLGRWLGEEYRIEQANPSEASTPPERNDVP